jgi:hypothetical protein
MCVNRTSGNHQPQRGVTILARQRNYASENPEGVTHAAIIHQSYFTRKIRLDDVRQSNLTQSSTPEGCNDSSTSTKLFIRKPRRVDTCRHYIHWSYFIGKIRSDDVCQSNVKQSSTPEGCNDSSTSTKLCIRNPGGVTHADIVCIRAIIHLDDVRQSNLTQSSTPEGCNDSSTSTKLCIRKPRRVDTCRHYIHWSYFIGKIRSDDVSQSNVKQSSTPEGCNDSSTSTKLCIRNPEGVTHAAIIHQSYFTRKIRLDDVRQSNLPQSSTPEGCNDSSTSTKLCIRKPEGVTPADIIFIGAISLGRFVQMMSSHGASQSI